LGVQNRMAAVLEGIIMRFENEIKNLTVPEAVGIR
jgi:hypothetical protein